MHVISRTGLLALAGKHPEALPALLQWYKVARRAHWRGLKDVRQVIPSADRVGDVLIFDILGNRYRLITRVQYDQERIYVKAVLNHREYDLRNG